MKKTWNDTYNGLQMQVIKGNKASRQVASKSPDYHVVQHESKYAPNITDAVV